MKNLVDIKFSLGDINPSVTRRCLAAYKDLRGDHLGRFAPCGCPEGIFTDPQDQVLGINCKVLQPTLVP